MSRTRSIVAAARTEPLAPEMPITTGLLPLFGKILLLARIKEFTAEYAEIAERGK
jgi:hypothetical protein